MRCHQCYVLVVALEISRVVLAMDSATEWTVVKLVDGVRLRLVQRVCSLTTFRLAAAAGMVGLD